MGFFKKLFNKEPKPYVDKRGMYFHVDCNRCNEILKVRIDRQYDLNNEGGTYRWRKTLVCPKCYAKMETEMTFNGNYDVASQEITGGKYVEEGE